MRVPRSHSYLESDQFFRRNTHTSNGIEYQSFKQPDPPFIDDSITAFHVSAIQFYNRSPMTKPTVPILIHRGKAIITLSTIMSILFFLKIKKRHVLPRLITWSFARPCSDGNIYEVIISHTI